MALKLPFVIDGKYRCDSIIGKGGMGCVYKAVQLTLGERDVAVKILNEELASDEEFRHRFDNEADVVGRLAHPNIVQIYDKMPFEHTYCIVMEYVDGRSLQQIINENIKEHKPPLSDKFVVKIGAQVARALQAAHDKNIIHRDIKPDNILVRTEDEAVKITDFGIARIEDSTFKTQTGVSLGTPKFMSPEQVIGRGIDAQSDLYALGVCLYYALTNEVPYDGDNAIAIATKHLYENPKPITDLNPTCNKALVQVIMEAMAKQKPDRFASGEEMAQALEAAIGSEPINPAEAPLRTTFPTPVSAGVTTKGLQGTPNHNTTTAMKTPLRTTFPTPRGGKIKPLMHKLWPAIVAVLIVIGIVSASVLVQRATNSKTQNSAYNIQGTSQTDGKSLIGTGDSSIGELIYPDRLTAEYKTTLISVDQLTSAGQIIKAHQMLEDFRNKRPDYRPTEVEHRLDLLTSQLPLSVPDVQKLLADRREKKGMAYIKADPPNLPLGLAYMTAARDMYKGLTGSYDHETEIVLLEAQIKTTSSPLTKEEVDKLETRVNDFTSIILQKDMDFPDDAESVLSNLILAKPSNYPLWIELAEVYHRRGFTDDARVLLQYVERQAPLSSEERKIAGQLYRSMEQETVPTK